MNLSEIKPGDKVYIFSADTKTHRGEATLISIDKDSIAMDCVPAGTTKGDILMDEPEYKKWLAQTCESLKGRWPYHVVKMPLDYFTGLNHQP